MEKWAAAVVVVQSVPMSKFPMRSIRTGPRILITAIRMVTRDTIRDMVISVLNLRRKAAPYMLSTANSRTPKILAITVGMPNRTFISSEKRATVA